MPGSQKKKGGHNCAKLVLINVNLQDILDAPDADAKVLSL